MSALVFDVFVFCLGFGIGWGLMDIRRMRETAHLRRHILEQALGRAPE